MHHEVKRLQGVRPGDGQFSLVLSWRDGTEQAVDLSGLVAGSRHFHRFVDEPGTFRDARVVNWGHGIDWPNGLDYSAENLARIADAQAEQDDKDAFVAWQAAHRLTNEEAGTILGYKKQSDQKLPIRRSAGSSLRENCHARTRFGPDPVFRPLPARRRSPVA